MYDPYELKKVNKSLDLSEHRHRRSSWLVRQLSSGKHEVNDSLSLPQLLLFGEQPSNNLLKLSKKHLRESVTLLK